MSLPLEFVKQAVARAATAEVTAYDAGMRAFIKEANLLTNGLPIAFGALSMIDTAKNLGAAAQSASSGDGTQAAKDLGWAGISGLTAYLSGGPLAAKVIGRTAAKVLANRKAGIVNDSLGTKLLNNFSDKSLGRMDSFHKSKFIDNRLANYMNDARNGSGASSMLMGLGAMSALDTAGRAAFGESPAERRAQQPGGSVVPTRKEATNELVHTGADTVNRYLSAFGGGY